MPNFGIFAGGLADSYQKQTEQNSLADYRTKELQLQEQAQKNAMQRDQMARIDKIRSDAMVHISDAVEQLKVAGKNNTEISQLLTPWVQQVAKLTKSSGLDDSPVFAQFSAELAKPSQVAVQGKLAAAKEPPGSADERRARAEYYRSQSKIFSPEPENTGGTTVQTAGGKVAELPPPPGQGNDLYEPTPQPVDGQPQQGGSKYIQSAYTPRQKAIVLSSGATPEQFDFDAVMYAYGNTTVATGYRSYHGVNPVTVLRSRAAQYWMDKFPGIMGPQQANAVMTEFKAMQHGANTAATIDARMTAALSKAQNTSKILTDPGPSGKSLIDSVDRTQYKDLNDFLVNWRGRTGNQPEIRLSIALETLASNYGVSLGMGNSVLTDMQTKRAQDMLQRGWATGQLKAAVDQINQEMVREEAGTREGMHRFIGGMTNDMQNPQGTAPASGSKPQYKFNPQTGELE